ncbi:hypothetical protein LJC58_04360 [Lachnospiraceae bacterium OttesenSCG-928-D06]|nr:hypothetical protein [Lachnospiraceae bacterium OttesenSCG-928-D06]
MQKSISEMAIIIKNLIPLDALDGYEINPAFRKVADDREIKNGVYCFKEFMTQMYDRLVTDGNLYEKSLKQPKETAGHDNVVSLSAISPFINHVTSILINIGNYGNLIDSNTAMVLGDRSVLAVVVGPQGGTTKQRISGSKMVEVMKFLASCGLHFDGIDLTGKKPDLSNSDLLRIQYPDKPDMLVGLKVMAIAHNEMSSSNDYYVFQRCDYRVLRSEAPDITEHLHIYIRTLPDQARRFILRLHQHYLDDGLVCKMKMHYFGVIFSYNYKSKVVWEFIPTPDGCYITTKANHLSNYVDEVKTFHTVLQEKISMGYGCEKKRFGKPCQKGCHGFSFLLNDSISDIEYDIERWFDKELSCLRYRN